MKRFLLLGVVSTVLCACASEPMPSGPVPAAISQTGDDPEGAERAIGYPDLPTMPRTDQPAQAWDGYGSNR